MSKDAEELVKSIQKIGKQPIPVMVGTVKSVDSGSGVCSVEIDELEIEDIALRAVDDGNSDGILLVPSVGSVVLVGRWNESRNFSVLSTTSLDEIYLKGDDFDGLVKVGELVEKLNNLENKVNDIITSYIAHVHPSNGTPPTPTPVLPPLTPTQQTELENQKVKHGNN